MLAFTKQNVLRLARTLFDRIDTASKKPVDCSTGPSELSFIIAIAWHQCFSGYLLTNALRFGIATFGRVSAFITSFSPMILLRARIKAVSA